MNLRRMELKTYTGGWTILGQCQIEMYPSALYICDACKSQIIPWSVFNTNIRPVAYITKCQIELKIELKDCLIFKDVG